MSNQRDKAGSDPNLFSTNNPWISPSNSLQNIAISFVDNTPERNPDKLSLLTQDSPRVWKENPHFWDNGSEENVNVENESYLKYSDGDQPNDRISDLTRPFIGNINLSSPSISTKINKNDFRCVWEGFGCNLCWWGVYIGCAPEKEQNIICDLFFTHKFVTILEESVPGLGLKIVRFVDFSPFLLRSSSKFSIARYNIGGCGRDGDIENLKENLPLGFSWIKCVEGFWKNPENKDIDSESFDWSRDEAQRSILAKAIERGAKNIEFFSNAPMWWMTEEKSSACGRLLSKNLREYAYYLAAVVWKARNNWGVELKSIAPFNEPSAWWWKYPGSQEGCILSRDEQRTILGLLRYELDERGLFDVIISASDENDVSTAVDTWKNYAKYPPVIDGKPTNDPALKFVGKCNVHSYYGLQPGRDNKNRENLRKCVANKVPLWASEYGDNDGSGFDLAKTIFQDLHYLQPSAWFYWQPTEPYSSWGLTNSQCDTQSKENSKASNTFARTYHVYTKIYVFAHFTRFLLPGYLILGTSEQDTIAAYDATGRRLIMIFMVTSGKKVVKNLELNEFTKIESKEIEVTASAFNGSFLWQEKKIPMQDCGMLSIECTEGAIYSVVLND
ncbi:hypothetical protein HK096_002597, partial [Nowakowskiella sp. JEL0078]